MRKLVGAFILIVMIVQAVAQPNLDCNCLTELFGGTRISSNTDGLISSLKKNDNINATTIAGKVHVDNHNEMLFSGVIDSNHYALLGNYPGVARVTKMEYYNFDIIGDRKDTTEVIQAIMSVAIYEIPYSVNVDEISGIYNQTMERLKKECNLTLKPIRGISVKGPNGKPLNKKWYRQYDSRESGTIVLAIQSYPEHSSYSFWIQVLRELGSWSY